MRRDLLSKLAVLTLNCSGMNGKRIFALRWHSVCGYLHRGNVCTRDLRIRHCKLRIKFDVCRLCNQGTQISVVKQLRENRITFSGGDAKAMLVRHYDPA